MSLSLHCDPLKCRALYAFECKIHFNFCLIYLASTLKISSTRVINYTNFEDRSFLGYTSASPDLIHCYASLDRFCEVYDELTIR